MTGLISKWVLSMAMTGALVASSGAAMAGQDKLAARKTVVLVHGAFADGSSWEKLIPLLMDKGLNVVAVQSPLSSLADDVDATNRVINQQTGPVILVGHSWGGSVITQAGANEKVKALVYVAAFAVDEGQSVNDLLKDYPAPPWAPSLVKDERGYLTLPLDTVTRYFAQDLPVAQAKVMTATQGPWFAGSMDDKPTVAAWRTKPSWFVLSQNDGMVNPKMQEAMATKINATVVRLPTSHVPMLSKPKEVAAVILSASSSVH